jgi:Zn-dependent peptidase ImmA (M78 family)
MEQITLAVSKLTKKYKTNCPFKIARFLGIEILHEDLGNTFGYYSKNFRIKIIHINEKAGDKLKKYICSHELGHAILHPDANTPFLKKHTFFSTEKIEQEANYFAMKLLFSDDFNTGSITYREAIKEYGVPEQLVKSNLKKIYP